MKQFIYMTMIAAAIGLTSCGDDNDGPKESESKDLDYSAAVADSWHNYTVNVARLLKDDATSLYNSWATAYNGGEAYATTFKNHNNASYRSELECIEEILDGCADIANEVGTAKIGDPYNLYMAKRYEEALYAVESWYSWHSREDYRNNIYSIRNSYYGTSDINGTPAAASLYTLVNSVDPAINSEMVSAIDAAASAIWSIPSPLRNNINSSESLNAMVKCSELEQVINNKLKPLISNLTGKNSELHAIIVNYVDNIVLPTYLQLKERNEALYTSVQNLSSNRTDNAFEAACNAWLEAREPWERSEAFLFGPVDALGLDPNMDSWPLDQEAIVQVLKSGNFSELEWSDGDDDNRVESSQNIRGFHTLEFLLFKDGQPRKVK